MWWYLLKRLGLSVVIILLAVATLFLMLHMIPGDPASIALGPRATPEIQAAYAAKMHLDKPLAYQFLIYAGNVLQGDLGSDVFSNRSAATARLIVNGNCSDSVRATPRFEKTSLPRSPCRPLPA